MSNNSCVPAKSCSEFFIDLLLIGLGGIFLLFLASPYIAIIVALYLAIIGKLVGAVWVSLIAIVAGCVLDSLGL